MNDAAAFWLFVCFVFFWGYILHLQGRVERLEELTKPPKKDRAPVKVADGVYRYPEDVTWTRGYSEKW